MAHDKTLPLLRGENLSSFGMANNLVEEWLLAHDVAHSSRTAYRRNIRNFQRWLFTNESLTPTRQTILEYKKFLISKNYTACTQSNYLCAIREFFKFMERVHGLPNPTRDLKAIRHPSGHRKDALSLKQLVAVLASIPTTDLRGLRDATILNLAARTGLRGCELSRADVGDIQQRDGCHILLVQGKGHTEKDRLVVLSADCHRVLQAYLSCRKAIRPSDPLFASVSRGCPGARLGTTTLRKIAKHYLKKSGINSPRVTLHSFRHTAISLALSGGATLLEAKEMARHEQIASTMVYAHAAHRLETAAEFKLEQLLRGSTPIATNDEDLP